MDLDTITVTWMDDRVATYPNVSSSVRDGVLHLHPVHAAQFPAGREVASPDLPTSAPGSRPSSPQPASRSSGPPREPVDALDLPVRPRYSRSALPLPRSTYCSRCECPAFTWRGGHPPHLSPGKDRTVSEFAEITLNGCCSEGGGARGLVQAGHYVVGVDTDPGCRDGYLRSGAHEFICADILDVLADTSFLSRFTFADIGPPCQGYSGMSHCRPEIEGKYPRLIRPIQALLDANWAGRPYVIENVEGARSELRDPVTYCMAMFSRPGYRHRLLEAGGGLTLAPPAPLEGLHPGIRRNKACGWPHPVPVARAGHWEPGKYVSVAGHERKAPVFSVMEINWMSNRDRVKEAIPPYLGAEIARQLALWRSAQNPSRSG